MQDIVMILGHLYFHWNMSSEAEEWNPVIMRCLSRTRDSEFSVEDAFNIRQEMRRKGLNPAAIALLVLQLEDVDPVRKNDAIDGYC